jgi:hypothetical protein
MWKLSLADKAAPAYPAQDGRRSKRVAMRKGASLVVDLGSHPQRIPCLIVDCSPEGFRLRGGFRLKRGQIVEVIPTDELGARIKPLASFFFRLLSQKLAACVPCCSQNGNDFEDQHVSRLEKTLPEHSFDRHRIGTSHGTSGTTRRSSAAPGQLSLGGRLCWLFAPPTRLLWSNQ